MKEALYYEKRDDGRVKCSLCPHNCLIKEGSVGLCGVRKNEKGTLYTQNYARISSWGMDPIEKKPLYHFYPGSYIFSVGSIGCNFECRFCQNWQIAQCTDVTTMGVMPEELVKWAMERYGNIGIAFTYSEPLVWYEYVLETARLAKEKEFKTAVITNGFINKEPLEQLLPYVDAMNIDVKAYTDSFYKKHTKGRLAPVLETVELASKHCHVEVTNLIIPGLNDAEEETESLADWLAGINPDIPLHITRYFPNYKLNTPPTPLKTLEKAREIASQKLNYVYIGNVLGGSTTFCPNCGKPLVKRNGYVWNGGLKGRRCRDCGEEINIII